MIVVPVLIVRAKAAARGFEVVAIVAATSAGTLYVLIIQVQVVRESVVSRARRRPLFGVALFLLKIREYGDVI